MNWAAPATLIVFLVPLTAVPSESQKATGRTISYRTAVEVLERDADDKPLKGSTERVGVTLHETGPSAGNYSQIRIVVDWERKDSGGVYSGTIFRTFADADTQEVGLQGEFGKGWSKGAYKCVGGSGRYAEATCSGTYQGQSFENGMAAAHWSGTITFKDKE